MQFHTINNQENKMLRRITSKLTKNAIISTTNNQRRLYQAISKYLL